MMRPEVAQSGVNGIAARVALDRVDQFRQYFGPVFYRHIQDIPKQTVHTSSALSDGEGFKVGEIVDGNGNIRSANE